MNTTSPSAWIPVCALEDIQSETGVCALVNGRQIAIFRLGECLYALDNLDPASGANVLSRGIVGDMHGELVVASPIYKHHYSLLTGRCLEDAALAVNVHALRVTVSRVWVQARPRPSALSQRRSHRAWHSELMRTRSATGTRREPLRLRPPAHI